MTRLRYKLSSYRAAREIAPERGRLWALAVAVRLKACAPPPSAVLLQDGELRRHFLTHL